MEQYFNVEYQKKKVGFLCLAVEGLYYAIRCRIKIAGMRLYVQTSELTADLGLCVPMDNGFGFDTRKPVKSIPGTIQKVYLSKYKINQSRYEIDPSKPFEQLSALAGGRLSVENGKYYFNPQ